MNGRYLVTYPLFVTIHFIPAALAAARPMALSSTTTQLQRTENKDNLPTRVYES